MKDKIEGMNWTDGSGKALSALAKAMTSIERESHSKESEYYSDPMLYVKDLNTGSAVMLVPSSNESGKTHGRGYRKCSMVRQRIPHKVPPKLQIAVLLDMLVGMLVPKGEDVTGPLGKAAYKRIAQAMVKAQNADSWLKNNAKHSASVQEVMGQLLDMTWSERAGDSLLNMVALPLDGMDVTMKDLEQIVHNKSGQHG